MAKSNNHHFIVNGRKIETRIEEMDIHKLQFWRENPRVHSVVNKHGENISDAKIEEILWKDFESVTHKLYGDIKQNGGLIDEILVKGKVVLEGNSRLCAYRYLYKNAKNANEKAKWNFIRAKILPDNTPNEAIFSILGTWHIKGKAEWKSFEKSAYIYRLHKEFNKTLDEITEIAKIKTKTEVKNIIDAYETMIKNKLDGSKDQNKYSAIFEIVKNRKMQQIRVEQPEIWNKSIEAVKNNKFQRAEDVRNLPKVIADKKAQKKFFEDDHNFTDALMVAKKSHPEHNDSFYSKIKKITQNLKDISMEKIEEIKEDSQKRCIITAFCKEADKLSRRISKK